MGSNVVLLTGASGLLGSWLRATVPTGIDLVALTHRTPLPGVTTVTADLRDHAATAAAVADVRPSLVIHAAMVVDEPSIVGATAHIVEAAAAANADVVHISTDAVFCGDGRPVDEYVAPDPIWDYGQWKAQAETIVLAGSRGSCTVRLPLVVSLDPEDHAVRRIRAGVVDGEPTRWYDDEERQPAMAVELAAAIWRIAALDPADRSGPWHLPGPETLTRYAIAQRVISALGLASTTIEPVPTPGGAIRPHRIHMLADRARTQIGWDPAPILV